MATGDLHGNLERLRVQLQSIQYPHTFDVQGLKEGIPACILPLVHYSLLGYSRHLARFLSANGYELWAKSDLRFMESTLKFLRQEFNYRSALTMAQIFARGYAERKLLFLCDVIQMSKRKHNELLKLVVHEKTHHVHKVNDHPANLATARRACEDACATSSPFMETKPWECTLRMPEEKASMAATVPPVPASDSAAQATALEMEPKHHPRKISLETDMDNNEILAALTAAEQEQLIVSRMSSPATLKPDGDDLSQTTHDYLPQFDPPPSSESLSTSHDDDRHYSQQDQPPSSGSLSASNNYEHPYLLRAQPPPSSQPMSTVHDNDHHSIPGTQHPSFSRPSSASRDSDRHHLLQAQPPPSSRPLNASFDNDHQEQNIVQDYHDELCQKIMEMADRLEARFCTLEDGITKARETLQEKLVTLEGRISLLEAVVPHQEMELDSARKLLQHQTSLNQQEHGFESFDRKHQENFLPQQVMQPMHQVSSGWQENGFDMARWQLQLEMNSQHSTPRTLFQENLHNCECEQILWIPHQKAPATIVGINPYFNILNCRHPSGPGMPMPVLDQHPQTIRDISNTHQHKENNVSKRGESNEHLFKVPEKVCNTYPEKRPLSTQDIVADIQSRFTRTMELLYKDGQV
ncbi:unnamed protein product [Calypogeia fissa]